MPFELSEKVFEVKYTIPQVGDKEQLLALSQKNADYALREWKHKQALVRVEKPLESEVLLEMQEALHLSEMPNHIECFDNSNFQGA